MRVKEHQVCRSALLLLGIIIHVCTAQITPMVCTESFQILVGAPFTLQEDLMSHENCSFLVATSGGGWTQSTMEWTFDGTEYIFHKTGDYSYDCSGEEERGGGEEAGGVGNFSIVPAQYTISLCDGQCPTLYHVTTGDSVRWVVVSGQEEPIDCIILLHKEDGDELVEQFPSNITQYRFQENGRFRLICDNNPEINATIVVGEKEETVDSNLLPLLYTHVALMAAAFGVLLPVAMFLKYHGLDHAYAVLLPVGMLLAACGLVLVVIYVQLTHGDHFRFVIHGVVGLALLLFLLVAMPLLLVHRRVRLFHYRLGHIVAFFGMGNVMLGLSILSVSFAVAIVLCVAYGLWLAVAISFYVFYSSPTTSEKYSLDKDNKKTTAIVSLEMASKNGSHKLSCSSLQSNSTTNATTKGPQPLAKSIISEEKMVQVRKKSMDFYEAQKHMMQLNRELGLKHELAKQLEEEEELKVRLEESNPKPFRDTAGTSSDDLEDNQSSPELEDPFPSLDRSQSHRQRKKSLSSDEDEEEDDDDDDDNDDDDDYNNYLESHKVKSPSTVNRSHTFNFGGELKKVHSMPGNQINYDSDNTSEKGGSLRITRHSKRARAKLDCMFAIQSPSSEVPLSPPSFNITPSSPPPSSPTLEYELQDESTDSTTLLISKNTSSTPLMPMQTITETSAGAGGGTGTGGRRRKAAVVPPVLTAPEPVLDQPQGSSNPFSSSPSNLSVNSGRQQRTNSPRPCRRGISPTGGSAGGASSPGDSPKPRKKKVSVAQIEATIVPPTPVNLQPPQHVGIPRSPSFNSSRSHQDAFADNAFRSVMKISHDAIVCANSVGDIVFWSTGASKMFGYTPGEAIGSSLEMIIPQSYKERHRNGISKRTEETQNYLRKHSYAPEEQKHARLYAVHGVTKGGHEFPVEVNVTSFVLDGEIFFTGVINELAKTSKNSRNNSISSSQNDLNEVALKQRALAVGAQVKMAHNLRSAEHISQRELEKVLKGSLGTSFEVDSYQMEQMVTGIMKAGDPDDTGVISFVSLIQLLSKHQLYISESGLIARYGKTKSSDNSSNSRNRWSQRAWEYLYGNVFNIMWLFLYLALNLVLFAVGIGLLGSRRGSEDMWNMWAYGTGPVLSMNCVLILLPTLSSLVHAMRNSKWMNKVFPLKKPYLFHTIIAFGLLFWTGIHLLTHLCSFGLDSRYEWSFRNGIIENIFPTITGIIVLAIFTAMGVSSIKPLRSKLRFIPFYLIHWVGGAAFYLLLLVHGVHYWNPSFWKWLLPALVIFGAERIHKHVILHRKKTNIRCAGRYDSVSRTAIVELDKPQMMDFEPGQYMLLNLPKIGTFKWQACHISSGPKEDKLTVHIPYSNDIWFQKAFEHLKENPHNMQQPSQNTRGGGRGEQKNARLSQVESGAEEGNNQFPAYFVGPYGSVDNIKLLFKYKVSTLVCGGEGPHAAKAIIKKFLDYRSKMTCHCGCQPILSKLYFVWVIPSGNDFEWFTDYLSDLCEDEHLHRYLDIRVFLTNCDSAPDELASALLQLGLKTAGDKVTVRRPSQPQLNNLYHMTSYGLPDFTSLLDYISIHHSAKNTFTEYGVFSVGELKHSMQKDLMSAINKTNKPGNLEFKYQNITT